MVHCLEIISSASEGSKSLTKHIFETQTLDKVVLQLSIVIEELNQGTQQMQGDLLKLQLAMMDKLLLATTNACKDHAPAKKVLLKVNTFTPVLVYLARVGDKLNSEPFYSEDRVIAVLNLLSQATDGEKTSQDWILQNVKIDEICSKLFS